MRTASEPGRTWRWVAGAAVVFAGTSPIFADQLLDAASRVSLCPFRSATGLDGPFCGMTRATLLAATGSFRDASAAHLAWPLTLGLAWFFVGAAVWDSWTRTRLAPTVIRFVLKHWLWIFGGMAVLGLLR